MADDLLDCLVVGGGPAGLTAAIYLARFHLRVAVFDRGGGRAQSIPITHNHAGYPAGVKGADLVARMEAQARQFGADVQSGHVTDLATSGTGFVATVDSALVRARSVLIATGVSNTAPPMISDTLHDQAVAQNLLRYCPVCDGYEVTDTHVGVIGTGERGVREALFLRSFTASITLMAPDGPHGLSDSDHEALREAGVTLIDGPIRKYKITDQKLTIETASGATMFDAVYPALGSTVHSELAVALGADVTDSGCIRIDAHQRTSVAGLYAAGDVVLGLDQISHAMGEAGVAATTIRNDLNAQSALRR